MAHRCRIICDPGSQVSFISNRFINQLAIRRRPCTIEVEGVGSVTTRTRGLVTLKLASINNLFGIEIEFHVLDTITTPTPVANIAPECWMHLQALDLADPSFGRTGRIDALIGADVWGAIINEGIVRGSMHEPFAQQTKLGWVVFGPATIDDTTSPSVRSLHTHVEEDMATEQRLDAMVRLFCELDHKPDSTPEEDDICEQIFMATHHRDSDGRYVVQIPFRPDAPTLGNSHPLALRQFYQLEKRLAANPELKAKYIAFMREYIDLGHMVLAMGKHGHPSQCYFIPHHAVLAKFRVVFNASAKTSAGISLNETQLVGPAIQDLLVNIILRFRRFAVALSADVEKMFRQVQVDPRHRCWQQILWRESPDEPIQTYQLTTVTYGMACGPYNAIRAMQQCAKDNHGIIPDGNRAATALGSILRDFYVDDYLSSVETSDLAVQLAGDIDAVLRTAKFPLRKWLSNDSATLTRITQTSSPTATIELRSAEATVLGLHWDPTTDEFFYRLTMNSEPTKTKRLILSDTARLYDPTNMLAPVIIVAKVFIQTLWLEGLGWDGELPAVLLTEWQEYRANLYQLERIRIPRCLNMGASVTSHLHGFCDASQKAYAAVLYICSVDGNGNFSSSLVTAKTRVAPAKLDKHGTPLATIPRLELCAARLLAELFANSRQALQLANAPYTLWSDSSIVLGWLRKSPSTLKQYVANRVTYIQQHTEVAKWQHVRTHLNPADCASRGISASALVTHELWWRGPVELMRDNQQIDIPELDDDELNAMAFESKPIKAHVASAVQPNTIQTRFRRGDEILTINLVERFSQLGRLLRTTAYILRSNPSRRHYWHHTLVETEELAVALNWHIRAEQERYFGSDILHLKQSRQVAATSKLASLAPYIGSDGILRVGGRLQRSALLTDQVNPIILAKEGTLSLLIVRDIHLRNAHAQHALMQQTLRQRYWIIGGRILVNQCVYNCAICRRHSRQMAQQQMASLPRARVTASPPFSSTGVDYCGPFNVRIGAQRTRTTKKTYAAIFVCMATKAVHIELADDLSARAFLNVFARFTSRRGPCEHLYSDNGTQFQMASKILKTDLAEWRGEYVRQEVANKGTQWHFVPAASPHQNGLCEAAVKSAKKHLYRVVGGQTLYYDQLNTLLTRIEGCLNSRPLVALHDGVDDRLALSPADFLIGRSIVAVPEPREHTLPTNRTHHWRLLRQQHQSFWDRWHDEYLVSLQQRSKWRRPAENLRVGDVIVMRHENLPPSEWRLGRITEVHPGSDNLVRNVTVEYCAIDARDGNYKRKQTTRAAQKVCRLFSDDPEPTGPAGQEMYNNIASS